MGEDIVSIFNIWREGRGGVMRKEFEDAMTRMKGANGAARAAFLNNVSQTCSEVNAFYASASGPERKAFLKQARESSRQMWASGDWPSALGLAIALLNAESRFVPGDDAAYVRIQTHRIIKEAATLIARH